MGLFNWMDVQVKKMNWIDMGCTKWASAAAGLLLAKLWPPILSLDWYWYLVIVLVLSLKPITKLFSK